MLYILDTQYTLYLQYIQFTLYAIYTRYTVYPVYNTPWLLSIELLVVSQFSLKMGIVFVNDGHINILEGTVSFGVPSRFSWYNLCVYCTARSSWLDVGPVLEMNQTCVVSFRNKTYDGRTIWIVQKNEKKTIVS